MEPLYITTSRLALRNLQQQDLTCFHEYRSNPEVTKYQGFDVMTREEAHEFIIAQHDKLFGKPGEWVQYAIVHNSTMKLIGDCAVKLDAHDDRLAEIGMTISPKHQKQGYALEALQGIMRFLFNTQKVHRITETVDAENAASIALLKAAGFRQEGHFIENIFFKGKWGSEFQYAMLKREWDEF